MLVLLSFTEPNQEPACLLGSVTSSPFGGGTNGGEIGCGGSGFAPRPVPVKCKSYSWVFSSFGRTVVYVEVALHEEEEEKEEEVRASQRAYVCVCYMYTRVLMFAFCFVLLFRSFGMEATNRLGGIEKCVIYSMLYTHDHTCQA